MKEYQNSEAVLPDISLSALKSSGPKMNLLASTSVTAHAMIHAPLPLAAEWYIFILKIKIMLCTILFLFWFKIANKFRNYLKVNQRFFCIKDISHVAHFDHI